jgi:hypothetical protein
MKSELTQASELTAKLAELAKQAGSRNGDEVAVNQLATFGELLVVLARYMDRAQKTIRNLTWVLTVLTFFLVILTFFLVIDAVMRL